MNICRICSLPGKYKDLCQLHYRRKERNGHFDLVRKSIPRLIKQTGYLCIYHNGKKMQHHRYIMEKELGRLLKKTEHVHHLNGNKTDNRPENLFITTNSDHIKTFHTKKKIVDWTQYIVPPKMHRFHPVIYKACLVNNCKIKPKYRSLCSRHYMSYKRSIR